jgi:ATP-dependent Lon protease
MPIREETFLTLPAFPLKNGVLFPYLMLPLAVSRPGTVAAVEAALASEDKILAVFAMREPEAEKPKAEDLHAIGTLAVIKKMARFEDTLHIVAQGIQRVELLGVTQAEPFLNVRVHRLLDPEDLSTETEALHRAVLDLAHQMSEMVQPQLQMGLSHIIGDVDKPLHQAYLLASLLTLSVEKEQMLLAAATQHEALRLVHDHLHHEVRVLALRKKIANEAQTEINKEQREYMLRQQMRAIQGELGEQSPQQADVADLRKRLEETELPELARKEVEKELGRMEHMSPSAPDYQVLRTYLDLALELPWNETTEDNLNLPRAREILNADHFDLDEVKERIIEHLAVMKLNPEAKSPILCFVGPPGVGKTSVGQSISRALGRKFERMSLGGLHDEAELRGHRRTYIGAMPGRVIRAIRRAGVRNPLLMLDEIDKLGQDFRGDPAAALMEVLDPEQNREFHDNYLDLPFDLSQVFFITTANSLDGIPKPLLDRMEVLRLAGYSDEEKREIARRYLISRQIKEAGLGEEQLSIPEESLRYIIHRYTREAGVRELERTLGRIARKLAVRIASGSTEPLRMTPDDLVEILGPERFFAEELRKKLPPGVAAGLAWTQAGGEVLYVEAVRLPEGKGLTLTGQLGDVMQESARAAQSYIWSHVAELGIDPPAVHGCGVHIHVPAGAIPKDGPSAGVTMVVALAALYAQLAARSDTAMTGEITLSGLVLPVGGIKEKVLAAHRAGIRRVIIPSENEKDLRELPEQVSAEMQFIAVGSVEELLREAISDLLHQPRGQLRAKGG